jgi:vancomycin permeability regulator SanA
MKFTEQDISRQIDYVHRWFKSGDSFDYRNIFLKGDNGRREDDDRRDMVDTLVDRGIITRTIKVFYNRKSDRSLRGYVYHVT